MTTADASPSDCTHPGGECGLIARARSGDRAAADTLITSLYRWVLKVAADYARKRKVDRDELLSAGLYGVYKSIAAYVPGRGTWRTYAMHAAAREVAREADRLAGANARYVQLDREPLKEDAAEPTRSELLTAHVRAALGTLPPLERSLIELKWGLAQDGKRPNPHHWWDLIFRRLGLHHARARALLQSAEDKLRAILASLGAAQPHSNPEDGTDAADT